MLVAADIREVVGLSAVAILVGVAALVRLLGERLTGPWREGLSRPRGQRLSRLGGQGLSRPHKWSWCNGTLRWLK